MVKPPLDLDTLPLTALKPLTLELLEENAQLVRENTCLRAEIARLKGLKGKPEIKPSKPSGMEKGSGGSGASAEDSGRSRRRRGKSRAQPQERIVVKVQDVPPGSRFKGYERYVVQDLVLSTRTVEYRRERWLTPDGQTLIAPLPEGTCGHFGPEVKRFILLQYYQGQTTLPRLTALLRMIGLDISQRQIGRILSKDTAAFRAEAQEVLQAGLSSGGSGWISVDDTGARHKGVNGICTQIGNDRFTFFATTFSKSRLNFLTLLRAGNEAYTLNEAAFDYMRDRNLSQKVIALLRTAPQCVFADETAWKAHLQQLGITALRVHPDPTTIATEGALWGTVVAQGFLQDKVILSDDAGQFNVGTHALCWVHAERLVHKLEAFTATHRQAKERIRARIWWLYADLKAYKQAPTPQRRRELTRRFDKLFRTRTGWASLDRLLHRLLANRAELLQVLEHPDIPLHTNGSENDIRCQVTRRKISATTRSDDGRNSRDAFLGLLKTCFKLGISFWEYLGDRLGITTGTVPRLDALVAAP